jgi:ADP-ribose pyrophosphatase
MRSRSFTAIVSRARIGSLSWTMGRRKYDASTSGSRPSAVNGNWAIEGRSMTTINQHPWQTLDTKKLVTTEWLSVREDRVKTHTGSEITYTFVEHPGAVFVVPLIGGGKVLLLRHYRYTVQDWCWEVPAGGMGESDDPLETARSELEEEGGISNADLRFVDSFYVHNGTGNMRANVYMAQGGERGPSNPEESELFEVHEMTVDKVYEMARGGRITDGPSALALFLCEPLIRGGT